ncbi:hypothetical protein HYW82_02155 [Candidatus Peregrinibacteria bacterium]|nr:hypothetical protein [Candidatus Peregrinibacteria bacterium]
MKNFLKKFAVAILLINLGLTIQMSIASAQETTPTKPEGVFTPSEYVEMVQGGSKPDFGNHPDSNDILPGVGQATSPVYFALDMFRYFTSGIAFIMIIISAIKLVSTESDETAKEQKQHLTIGIVGLLVIQLADIVVKKMVFGEQGDAFEDVASAQFYGDESTQILRIMIGILHFMLGALAVLVIVVRGTTLIFQTEEEALTKAKEHILYAAGGLAVVGLSEVIVRGFIFPEKGSALPDIQVGRAIIVAVTNYLSSFVAISAFVVLLYAGYKYVVSGGNEEVNESTKKIFLGAIIALILALGAFAAVHTFVTLDETLPTRL